MTVHVSNHFSPLPSNSVGGGTRPRARFAAGRGKTPYHKSTSNFSHVIREEILVAPPLPASMFRSQLLLCRGWDSNPRPSAYETLALTRLSYPDLSRRRYQVPLPLSIVGYNFFMTKRFWQLVLLFNSVLWFLSLGFLTYSFGMLLVAFDWRQLLLAAAIFTAVSLTAIVLTALAHD